MWIFIALVSEHTTCSCRQFNGFLAMEMMGGNYGNVDVNSPQNHCVCPCETTKDQIALWLCKIWSKENRVEEKKRCDNSATQ